MMQILQSIITLAIACDVPSHTVFQTQGYFHLLRLTSWPSRPGSFDLNIIKQRTGCGSRCRFVGCTIKYANSTQRCASFMVVQMKIPCVKPTMLLPWFCTVSFSFSGWSAVRLSLRAYSFGLSLFLRERAALSTSGLDWFRLHPLIKSNARSPTRNSCVLVLGDVEGWQMFLMPEIYHQGVG